MIRYVSKVEHRALIILTYMRLFNSSHKRMPTMSEISVALQINSTDKVLLAIKWLCMNERLKRIGHGQYEFVKGVHND